MSIREAGDGDRAGLLALYLHLHETALPAGAALETAWAEMAADPRCHILVAGEGTRLLASCTCYLLPNLTRGARPFALVENVVTHPAHRRRGLASACLRRAVDIARAAGCYKIMLLTGSREEGTLRFYRQAGFNSEEKAGFCQRL